LLWSWKFATSGLNDFPSIRAFFIRRTRHGFEESSEIGAAARHRTKSEPEDSSLLNVVHQLRGGLARPWPKVRDIDRSSRSNQAPLYSQPGP
jgi:hypothetical protein